MNISLMEAAAKAWRSLWTPGVMGLIVTTTLVTLACLFAFASGAAWLAFQLSASVSNPWLADALRWGGSLGAFVLAWMFFPGIMPVVVSFFDDRIATAIEAHDYAIAPSARAIRFWPELFHDLGFSLKALGLNLLCLPLYLVPVLNLCLFYVLNGYLLGREFFVMVARRHVAYADAERLRRDHAGSVFLAGVALTLLATIPVLNLIAPFWGVALAVHLFHQTQANRNLLEYR